MANTDSDIAVLQYEHTVLINGEDARTLLHLKRILCSGDSSQLRGQAFFDWGKRIGDILERGLILGPDEEL